MRFALKFLLIAGFPDSLIEFRGELIRALVEAGLDVHVACPSIHQIKGLRDQIDNLGATTHEITLQRTGVNPLYDIRTLFDLWALMRKIKPDYVLGYTIKPVIYGGLAGWLARVRMRSSLITGLGYAFQNDSHSRRKAILNRLVRWLYGFTLRRSQLIFFQNPDDEALFRSNKILSSSTRSVVVSGSGVDISRFAPKPLPRKLTFLLIARLLGSKGVREYIEAAQFIKKLDPAVSFKLVGWIDINPDAIEQQELDAWISSGVVEYLGRMKDVRPAIENSSVFVLPSYREGTPRTVLEAMAMGRAIITTDAPGCRETVIDRDNGFLVPIKSVESLILAMKEFVSDPGLASRMGERSRHIAVERYDVHKVNAVMLREMGIPG